MALRPPLVPAAVLAVAICLVLVLGAAPPAGAQGSASVVAPSFPASRLSISVPRTARAGGIVTVTFRGTNALFNPGQPLASPAYTVDAFVADRRAVPQCPRTYSAMLDSVIALDSGSIFQFVRARTVGKEGAFRFSQRYRAGTARRVVFCAYTRLVTDDVAVSALRRTLRAARRR
jgi:hypothetical protein